jgi:hypothetical protein
MSNRGTSSTAASDRIRSGIMMPQYLQAPAGCACRRSCGHAEPWQRSAYFPGHQLRRGALQHDATRPRGVTPGLQRLRQPPWQMLYPDSRSHLLRPSSLSGGKSFRPPGCWCGIRSRRFPFARPRPSFAAFTAGGACGPAATHECGAGVNLSNGEPRKARLSLLKFKDSPALGTITYLTYLTYST